MKKLLLICTLAVTVFSLQAAEAVTKFNLSGFKVKIVQAKEFSYSCQSSPEENTDGVLILKAKTENEALTIYTPKVDEINLSNCELTMRLKEKKEALTLYMDKGSKASIDVDLKHLRTEIKDSSSLLVSGYVTDVICKLDNASKIESPKLNVETITVDATNKSMILLMVQAKALEINVSQESAAVLRGKAETLKGTTTQMGRIKTDKLNIFNSKIDIQEK